MRKKALLSTLVVFMAFTGPLQAADTSDLWVALDTLWVLIAAFMVFFMLAGFGMVEAGLIRSKNAGNILMKNMMDFCMASLGFFICGYALMFGGEGPLLGSQGWLLMNVESPVGIPLHAFWMFQAAFCGAAATIVKESGRKRGIIDIDLSSSGSGYNKFWIPAGGLRLPKSSSTSIEIEDEKGNIRTQNDIEMDGFGVWSFINSVAPKQVDRLLKRNDVSKTDIDQFIFHQASKMTLESIRKSMKLNEEQVFINIQNIGNTVSASIPIALRDAIDQGGIDNGSTLIISGFGVGLSYGTILMEY